MKVTITIDGAEQADRDALNLTFLAFKAQGLVSIKKIGPSLQEWTLTCAGATHTLLVSINYVNTIVNGNIQPIENNTVTENKGGETKSAPVPAGQPAHETIVNDSKRETSKPLELFSLRLVPRHEVKDFLTFWNSHIWLPKVRGTDRQCKEIRIALSRPLFADYYKEGVAEIAKSKFLRGACPGHDGLKFKLDLDWFLHPDNFDKIIEGKYRDKDETKPIEKNTYEEDKL